MALAQNYKEARILKVMEDNMETVEPALKEAFAKYSRFTVTVMLNVKSHRPSRTGCRSPRSLKSRDWRIRISSASRSGSSAAMAGHTISDTADWITYWQQPERQRSGTGYRGIFQHRRTVFQVVSGSFDREVAAGGRRQRRRTWDRSPWLMDMYMSQASPWVPTRTRR